ncbi:MAG: DUF445 domain-containing protein [Campylobacteraceae bacterium 4484_4]|nr:MAG: DUF445 domain-containing protein [Campylobacteraceae bacterium 4484_4]
MERLDQSTLTDLVSALIVALSFAVPDPLHRPLLYTGLFALSGALTNHLAVHMLFEKVPFLYGSGIIELKFDALKEALKKMIMEQFFSREQLTRFVMQEEEKLDLVPIVEKTDFTPAFEALKKTVLESPFGPMIQMVGGEEKLDALRDPFEAKLKAAVGKIVGSEAFKTQLKSQISQSAVSADLLGMVEQLIEKRMAELTPGMVKKMMHNLMREHLGWLVVWGAVFGGAIGLLSSFIVG